MSSTGRIGWALALLTLWTLGVRWLGIDFGVPCMKEADTFIADHVRMLREGEVKFDRALSAVQYPSLLAHIVAPLSNDVGAPRGDETTLQEHLASAASVWVQVRKVVALISILIVPGTFLIARRFVSPAWALFAAAIPAMSLLHVMIAQEARAHGLVNAFSPFAIASALWLRRAPSWRSYLATAVTAALAIGSLHSGNFVLLPIFVAQALRRDRRWFDWRLLVVVAAAAVSFRTFYWYYFDEAAKQATAGDDAAQNFFSNLPLDGSGFTRLARTLWYYEPVALALLIVATIAWLTRRANSVERSRGGVERGDVLVVLAHALPYTAAFGLFDQTYERFLLPLLPSIATFAAWGASSIAARIAAPTARRVFVAACVAVLALPAFTSTKLAWLRSRPSTLDDTAQWIRANASDPSTAKLWVLPPLDFPVMRTVESLRYPPGHAAFFSPWSRYQNKLDDARRVPPLYQLFWLSGKVEFQPLVEDAVVDAYVRSHGPGIYITQMIDEHQSPERQSVVASIRRLGKLLARISPDGDPRFTDHQLWDQDVEADRWRNVTWRMLQARAVGPVIEIYRIDG